MTISNNYCDNKINQMRSPKDLSLILMKKIYNSIVLLSKKKKEFSINYNKIFISIAGISISLIVFYYFNSIASVNRGYNGGIGGEAILAVSVYIGIRYLFNKIKKHFSN